MNSIAFIDIEVDNTTGRICDIGAIDNDERFYHNTSINEFVEFLRNREFICGHNIINHDLIYLKKAINDFNSISKKVIDTLYLSPLLFPAKPYHKLLKDDKLQDDESNNPLNDSIKAKDLFNDEIAAFTGLSNRFKQILYLLLKDKKEFSSFFDYISYEFNEASNLETLILEEFNSLICQGAPLLKIISAHPIELAFGLALINCKDRYSISPRWVLKNFRGVERILFLLRNKPCLEGCSYCNTLLNIHKGLKEYFGFNSFRTYENETLQEKAAQAAIDNKSLLAVFPTGGGKSITFQLPALMNGVSAKGLTVVISPLQSLMKDQVDNLESRNITEAVTVNGLLDPIERAKSFERVEDGSASLLYISPESLRSKTIERLLLGRNVVRFVIDEAHCFSSWGQDFRVDYLYIGDFIKLIKEKKNLEDPIPVSCFTATAKLKVIEDICSYFKDKLSLDLEIFSSKASRKNLQYEVIQKESEEAKYNALRDLINEKNCPTIVYVSRTGRAYKLAERLNADGIDARPYHGKMDVKEKTANQTAFISGEFPIMVATSAFGMGVDKKDIGMVIHYDISDSLENYVQEAGRAGRDESLQADCYVLFNEDDLSKHFILLNQTKLSIQEIQQIWKAIKEITRFRNKVSNSALEIARKAGWDDSVNDIETRVITAIAALEESGYLKRGQNMPKVFANSILSKNAQEAIDKINASSRFDDKQKVNAIRIIKKLFSSKRKKEASDEVAEARVDYISDHLGIVKQEVIGIINLLREEKILADSKDLTAFIKKGENINRSLSIVQNFNKIENLLLEAFGVEEKTFNLKALNENADREGYEVNPNKIRILINFWAIKNWIKRSNALYSNNLIIIKCLYSKLILREKLEARFDIAIFIVKYLYEKINASTPELDKPEILVEFSVLEIKEAYEKNGEIFNKKISIEDVEDALFYLSRIDAIKIEGGFLVIYNGLTIDRIEEDNKRRYKAEDYQKLKQFYENKVQQIHIVGEYAKKMIEDYKEALQFVEDYFQLNYSSFISKYFPGSKGNEIKQNITPTKFKQLFGTLSPIQLNIIKDKEDKRIAVLAGPGSGKTRVLVHKLASLMLMEDIKHEQLLMLTFSRASATEFKKRLIALIGNAANFIDIKTFHSYCFDLLGKVGNLEKSDAILKSTIEKIKNREVEINKITKAVLVIDEAQDMDGDEFALIKILIEQNEEMRVIMVGDDDQNIYEFRGASAKYLEGFIKTNDTISHEMVENYRSKNNLVKFTNSFVESIHYRLKKTPIIANQLDNGQIKIIKYQSGNLIVPFVNDIISAELSGTTCLLATTNDKALQIAGLLLKKGIHTKLIQSNDGFKLSDLFEVRYFINLINTNDSLVSIDDNLWSTSMRELVNHFQRSSKLELCLNLLKDFEVTNTKIKYKSDLIVFIKESKLEDIYTGNGDTIFVSTIHKVKGKEFDNVFLMLENFIPSTDEKKRQIYVAMTRAKQNLTIHLNSNFLDHIKDEETYLISDFNIYNPPNQLAMQLGHKDVWLDCFISRQSNLSELMSGDTLIVNEKECQNFKGQTVLIFSKDFQNKIQELKQKGFKLMEAKVNFIIYWKKEDLEDEVKIILPQLYFENSY
ncbi:MAG TPA: RecQ family ATP-dependent DNA helicase [Saprospiraceae bacterium]|nr:RecQ family ATP-dependent DNA helicase [Saprospiraceae bacterium]